VTSPDGVGRVMAPAIDAHESHGGGVIHMPAGAAGLHGSGSVVIDADVPQRFQAFRTDQVLTAEEHCFRCFVCTSKMMNDPLFDEIGRTASVAFLAHIESRRSAFRANVKPVKE